MDAWTELRFPVGWQLGEGVERIGDAGVGAFLCLPTWEHMIPGGGCLVGCVNGATVGCGRAGGESNRDTEEKEQGDFFHNSYTGQKTGKMSTI